MKRSFTFSPSFILRQQRRRHHHHHHNKGRGGGGFDNSNNAALRQRSRAAKKLEEIDKKFGIFSQLQQCAIDENKAINDGNLPIVLPSFAAVDFGASPGGFTQVLSRGLSGVNNKLPSSSSASPSWNVISVDNRTISPPLRNTTHVRGSIEAHKTMRVILSKLEQQQQQQQSQNNTINNEEKEKGKEDVLPSRATLKRNRRVICVTNDTVAIIRRQGAAVAGNISLSAQFDNSISVTYAQNNLVMCAMRRAMSLLECFQQHHHYHNHRHRREYLHDEASSSPPPCFFVSKVLRSVHVGRVIEVAKAVFDHAELVQLDASSSKLERFLVASSSCRAHKKENKKKDEQMDNTTSEKQIVRNAEQQQAVAVQQQQKKSSSLLTSSLPFSLLSLPPESGEAVEWMCWGCLQIRSGQCLQCPRCAGGR